MLTKHVTRPVPLPHEPGQEVTIRMLSWLQIQEARTARLRALLARARDVADLVPTFQAAVQNGATAVVAAPASADALADYDAGTLLRLGVVGWTYEDPVTPENIDDLDEETKDVVARAIVGCFRRDREAQKNGSAPSTSPSAGRRARPTTGS